MNGAGSPKEERRCEVIKKKADGARDKEQENKIRKICQG